MKYGPELHAIDALDIDARYPHRRRPLVVGCCGFGGEGKTTWVEGMRAALEARGHRVCVVRSSASSPQILEGETHQQTIMREHRQALGRAGWAMARTLRHPPGVVLCDRTVYDIQAYSIALGPPHSWRTSFSEADERAYELLFHFRGNVRPLDLESPKRAPYAHLRRRWEEAMTEMLAHRPGFNGHPGIVLEGRTVPLEGA